MDIYKVKKSGLEDLRSIPFALEKDIQSLVEANLQSLFNVEFVRSEFPIGQFRLDTLAFDEETSSFVIIEYKKGHSYSVVDQGYSYLSVMLENKADFILEYNERMSNTLKRDEIDWSQSRVIFLAPSFNTYQKNSTNFRDIPFELWEINRYEGDLIVLDQYEPSSNNSIEEIGKSDSKIIKVSAEVRKRTEDDFLAKTDPEVREVWKSIKGFSEELGGTALFAGKSHLSIKVGKRSVCGVHFRKKNLIIGFHRGNMDPDGNRSKDFFTLDDPKGLANPADFKWKSGWQGYRYNVSVAKTTDLDYIKWLIKQRYDTLGKSKG